MSRYRGRYNRVWLRLLYGVAAVLIALLIALLIINSHTEKHYKEETRKWNISNIETPMENWSTPEQ